jgi:hypothetical protein
MLFLRRGGDGRGAKRCIQGCVGTDQIGFVDFSCAGNATTARSSDQQFAVVAERELWRGARK